MEKKEGEQSLKEKLLALWANKKLVKIASIALAGVLVLTLLIVLVACPNNGSKKDSSNSTSSGGGKTEIGTTFNTLTVNGENVFGKVSNDTESFSFIEEVTVKDDVTFTISYDMMGLLPATTKTIMLEEGDNVVYMTEFVEGEPQKVYTVTIRRRPVYDVEFYLYGYVWGDTQQVEEDSLAVQPTTPEREGYAFEKWDYDFAVPIIEDTVINASWTPIAYQVTYQLDGQTNDNDNPMTYTIESGIPQLLAPTTAPEYYSFKEWQLDGETVTGIEDGNYGDITLTAVWECYFRYGYSSVAHDREEKQGWHLSNYAKTLSELTVPEEIGGEAITEMGYRMFAECENLIKVTLPNSITAISRDAFQGCNSLKSIDIPDTVTTIGEYAFSNCNSLKSIDIPDNVTEIGYGAFEYCSSLENIDIPDKVTSINGSTFSGCGSLKSIDISDNVTEIGYRAFYGCSLESVTIGDGVTTIGESAFSNCNSLKSIGIPDTVTTIGEYAFSGCSSLENIDIPDNVTLIGQYTFYGCSSLKSLEIPNGVKQIATYAFSGCSSLKSVIVPESVTQIGYCAFYGCNGLESATLPFVGGTKSGDNNTYYFGYIFGASKNENNSSYVPTSLKSVAITSATKIIWRAFFECSSLESVKIYTVESIEGYAFYGCSSLLSVEIPDSVTVIGEYAFGNCSSLTSIKIGNGITSMGYRAFSGCDNLEGVYITDLAAWCNISFGSIYENPLHYAKNLFINDTLVTNLIIPDTVTQIKANVFSGCDSVKSIELGDHITFLGEWVFSNCTELVDVKIGKGITEMDGSVFRNCTKLQNVTIKDGATFLGYEMFYGCSSLESIDIPDSVVTIRDGAFNSCSALANVTIGTGVVYINKYTFYACNLTSVTFKNTSGWNYTTYGVLWTNYNPISSADLADTAKAAEYLSYTYAQVNWQRR